MSGVALYSLAEAYRLAFADAVDEETGELGEDALIARLDAISDDLAVKTDSVLKARRMFEAHAAAVKLEIDRLERMRAAAENRAKRLAAYVERCMRSAGLTEVRGTLFTARLQSNTPSVVIDDEQAIPPKFVLVEQKIQRAAIAKALKSGEEVPGAHLEQTTSIRIR